MIIPDFTREQALLKQGFSFIGGIDEVGRGAWAGPVVAACVIFPKNLIVKPEKWALKIRDSKTLSAKKRAELNDQIKGNTIWAIGECDNQEIDAIGIGKATQLAMRRSVDTLSQPPDYLLFDGRESISAPIQQEAVIDGDALIVSIAAASIIAKEYRDALMRRYDLKHPNYQFSTHVGYGTKNHIEALRSHGISHIHRKSYKPVKRFI